MVDRFQNDGRIPIFLISLKAGGVGLNLTAADTVIYLTPAKPCGGSASHGRTHRIGQQRIVTSIKLIARDTVEERVLRMQEKKRETLEGAVDAEVPLERLSAEALGSRRAAPLALASPGAGGFFVVRLRSRAEDHRCLHSAEELCPATEFMTSEPSIWGPALDLAVRIGCELAHEDHGGRSRRRQPRSPQLRPALQAIREGEFSFRAAAAMPPNSQDDHLNIVYRLILKPGLKFVRYDAIAYGAQPARGFLVGWFYFI